MRFNPRPAAETVHRLGPSRARITVTEYLDYECPFCAEVEEPLREILDAYQGDVALEVKHFPLGELHQWAGASALAAEAAANQGKFWQMHYLLIQHQDELSLETIVDLAENLGLNMSKFMADLQNPNTQAKVNRDIAEGEKNAVEETPTLLINGVRLVGKPTRENLDQAIKNCVQSL